MTLIFRILPYLLGMAGIIAAYLWAYQQGWDERDATAQRERLDAVQRNIEQTNAINAENRAIEQAAQREIDNAIATQLEDTRHRAAVLADDLERLHNRPDRMPTSATGTAADTECEGVTGAELSGPDARFLTRESARADELRSALIACYRYADAIDSSAAQNFLGPSSQIPPARGR